MEQLTFNGVTLTEETVQHTREWFSNNSLACIEEVQSGAVQVNGKKQYFSWRQEEAESALSGEYDYTVSFLQRAYYIQTGESIALLP